MAKKDLKYVIMYSPTTGYNRKDGYFKFISAKFTELLESKKVKKVKLIVDTTDEKYELDYKIPKEGGE